MIGLPGIAEGRMRGSRSSSASGSPAAPVAATISAVAAEAPPGRGAVAVPVLADWTSVLVGSPPAPLLPPGGPVTAEPVRSRGLEYSSMPKLISAKPAPMTAIARPGGTYHHQAPDSSA